MKSMIELISQKVVVYEASGVSFKGACAVIFMKKDEKCF